MKTLVILLFCIFTNAYAECTSKDLTDPEFLKSIGKENLIEHFKKPRDQDSVGWCSNFASADALSFAVGEPISSLDIAIHDFGKNSNNTQLDKLRLNHLNVSLNIAREYGYCPESVIPSNQTSTSNLGHSAILILMKSFQEIYDDYEAKGKPEDYCVDCTAGYEKVIKPSIPGVTSDLIKEVINKNHEDAVKAFKDLLDNICEGKRVKANPEYNVIYKAKLKGKTISSEFDKALDNNSMPLFTMNTNFYANESAVPAGSSGEHALVIVAKKMNNNGKCEYLVRNSWGKGCSYYQPQIQAKCDPEKGSFWMDEDQFKSGVESITVIKNEKNRVVLDKKTENSNPSFFSRFKKNLPSSNSTKNVIKTISQKISSAWRSLSKAFKY